MTVATLLDRLAATDSRSLSGIGFDVRRLRDLRDQARSREFQLQRMGFDVEQLRFLRWLVENGRDPEHACATPPGERRTAAKVTR